MKKNMSILFSSGKMDYLNTLTKIKGDKNIDELLKIYREKRDSYRKIPLKYPLIVLEGFDGSGKTSFSYILAKRLNAIRWCSPPKSIKHLRPYFNDKKQFREAFYVIGNYICAFEISKFLQRKPVVLDRYWISTITSMENYETKWPKGLLKPDFVFWVDIPEEIRLAKIHSRPKITEEERKLENQEYREKIYTKCSSIDCNFIPLKYGDFESMCLEVIKNINKK